MRSSFAEPDPQLIQEDSWGFPFHDACWEILNLARPGIQIDVQALFDIIWCYPHQDYMINFGHDYGGDAWYQWHPGTLPGGLELPLVQGDAEHKFFNPLELPELHRFLNESCNDRGSSCDSVPYGFQAANGGEDPFSRLPEEILQYILQYLPTADVLRLKLSSATYAKLPLSQSFWLSRFLPGREFEAIFEARLHAVSLRGRWHSLYQLVKSLRQTNHFANRLRVWKLACSWRDVLDQVASTSLHGDVEALQSLRWIDASTEIKGNWDIFNSGTRALYQRGIGIPSRVRRVFVSFVETWGRCYVSAIRFEAADGSSSILGYPHTASEILVPVAEGGIAGFHLAQDVRGFRGLAVLSTSGVLSKWVGESRGIPVRKLTLDSATTDNNGVQHLRCSLDVGFSDQICGTYP